MMQLPVSLMDMPTIFDKLNSVYRNYLESEIQSQVIPVSVFDFRYRGTLSSPFFPLRLFQMGTPLQNNVKPVGVPAENYKYKLLLDQSDMYSYILSKFPENTIEPKMIVWVLLEYIRYSIRPIYKILTVQVQVVEFQVAGGTRNPRATLFARASDYYVGTAQSVLPTSSIITVPRCRRFEASRVSATFFGEPLPGCSPTRSGYAQAIGKRSRRNNRGSPVQGAYSTGVTVSLVTRAPIFRNKFLFSTRDDDLESIF